MSFPAAWPPYLRRESALRQVEERLAQNLPPEPGAEQALRLERARLLAELGRKEEAKQAYLQIVERTPDHFAALNDLGNLLTETNHLAAAQIAYRQAVATHPDLPAGHANLAHLLHREGKLEKARAHYEEALRLAPDEAGTRQSFSYLLMELGEEEAAETHRRRGFAARPLSTLPYRGEKEPVRVLLLASPRGGHLPVDPFLDNRVFLVERAMTDFLDPSLPLPPHHLVLNAIGDADRCGDSLAAAERLLERTSAPVVNRPERVRATGRVANARRMAALDGVVTPRITMLPREDLTAAALEREGFVFPVLLRTPGFHGGDHFLRVEDADGLAPALARLPGRELAVIQFLDARSGDGKTRKYRVMMIGGELHPLHAAVSSNWKIHYSSAEMADSPLSHLYRAEDEAFLGDMPSILGPRAMRALGQVRDTLGLDYAGADFSLGPDGELLLFEANTTMTMPRPDKDPIWDYRRAPVQRLRDAVRTMLLSRAGMS